jgi:hypothetical protein
MPEKTRSTESGHLAAEGWPSLPLQEWDDTRATLHLWSQIVGKIRLAQAPLINHWWQVPLYVTARGLTTTAIPYGDSSFRSISTSSIMISGSRPAREGRNESD